MCLTLNFVKTFDRMKTEMENRIRRKGRTNVNGAARVLHVGPLPPGIGGMRTYFQGLLNSRLSEMFELHVVASDLIGKVLMRGFRRKVMNVLNATALMAAFLVAIARYRPRIVHLQTSSYTGFFEKSFLALLARLLLRKTVMHVHGGGFCDFYQQSGRLGGWLIRVCIRLNDRIITATPRMQETLTMIGTNPEKIRVVRNATEIPEKSIWDEEQPEQMDRNEVTVLFLNRIERAKGVLEFIRAAAAVSKEFESARFRIVGAGAAAGFIEELERRIAESEARGRIEFVGEVSEEVKAAELRQADIYVLPSHIEDLPYGLLEAMALGVPCIASQVGGVPSLIEDGGHGLLVQPKDVDALADAMRRLLSDGRLRQELGTKARQRIEQDFSWSRRAEQIAEIYNELLGGPAQTGNN